MKSTNKQQKFFTAELKTPVGIMLAIGDDEALYFLDFVDRSSLQPKIDRVLSANHAQAEPGRCQAIEIIEQELASYFKHTLTQFCTPLMMTGTAFQKSVWKALRRIPYGATCSYADIAKDIGAPTAYRAVARANSTNNFAIVIPCHRVIASDGTLGGYSSGISKKQWLLDHERKTHS